MSMVNRDAFSDIASAADRTLSGPEDACDQMQPETTLQDELFSEVMRSVCYWSTVLLLATAGAVLLYWRLTHAVLSDAVPGSDPFGLTTPRWLIVSLPPTAVAASLGHAAWSAIRGERIWGMLATAAGFIAVMGVTALLETHLAAF